MWGGDMIVKVFLAHPLFAKDKQPFIKDIGMEFVSGTTGLCTDKGNNPVHLMDKVLAMCRMNTAPGCYKQHTYSSDCIRKKYPGFPVSLKKKPWTCLDQQREEEHGIQ
jgi:hypothetical protein